MNIFKSAPPISFTSPKVDASSCSKEVRCTIKTMDQSKLKGKEMDKLKPGNNSLVKPFTRQNFFYYYVPALGTASYTVLSINVLNPTLRFSLFPKRDLTNVLLATALFGTGCYLYSRPHIKESTKNSRYGYSALGSVMFNFSSVLLWAILRSLLPENVVVCSAAGLASSYLLVRGATNYVEFVDNKSSI